MRGGGIDGFYFRPHPHSPPSMLVSCRARQVLYIPSFWFHYIVSLKYSIQCNTRSGTPPNEEGKVEIEQCLGIRYVCAPQEGADEMRAHIHRTHARAHTHKHAPAYTRIHTHTRARTHAHTHTPSLGDMFKYNGGSRKNSKLRKGAA